MTRKEFATQVQWMAAQVGAQFSDPEEDWQPVVFGLSKKGEMSIAAIHPDLFENTNTKDLLAAKLNELLRQLGAGSMYALLTSSWMLLCRDDDDGSQLEQANHEGLGENPEREEVLMLTVRDSEGSDVYTAHILRDGEQPPVLGKWECLSDKGSFSGRFVA